MKDIEDPEKVSEGEGMEVGKINKTDNDLESQGRILGKRLIM